MKVHVELQFFEGCPNHRKMKDNLTEAIQGIEDMIQVVETAIEDDEAAVKLKFRGSPTLLINGADSDGVPPPEIGTRCCRLYPNGIPSAQVIRRQIEQAHAKG